MHAQEHKATENKCMISPQIRASSTPTAPPGDWLIQYFKIMKLKLFFLMFYTISGVKSTFQCKHWDICI